MSKIAFTVTIECDFEWTDEALAEMKHNLIYKATKQLPYIVDRGPVEIPNEMTVEHSVIDVREFPIPFDPLCGRYAAAIEDYDIYIVDGREGVTVTPEDRVAWVRDEEGTFNPENGHFLCDACYVGAGMPTSPSGWVCP